MSERTVREMHQMAAFLPKDDRELNGLDDEGLIAYITAARAARNQDEITRALQILVYGYWNIVVRRVALKVPQQYVEDVTGNAIVSALSSAFDGTSVGELRSWLNTIVDRRIADFHRRASRPQETEPLPQGGDDSGWVEPSVPSEEGCVEVADAVERVLARSSEVHRRAVELVIFEDRPAAAAAAELEAMTAQNVHQIVSRFRAALRVELDREPG